MPSHAQAPTFGYEKLVGSKTSFRILNKLWTTTYAAAKFQSLVGPVFVPSVHSDVLVEHTRHPARADLERGDSLYLSCNLNFESYM